MVVLIVEQERVVPGVAVDLRINDAQAIVQQRKDDLTRTRRCKTPVGRKTGDEETGLGARQRRRQIPSYS
jgi:hypothetical protein